MKKGEMTKAGRRLARIFSKQHGSVTNGIAMLGISQGTFYDDIARQTPSDWERGIYIDDIIKTIGEESYKEIKDSYDSSELSEPDESYANQNKVLKELLNMQKDIKEVKEQVNLIANTIPGFIGLLQKNM
jgi:hypothetical protein